MTCEQILEIFISIQNNLQKDIILVTNIISAFNNEFTSKMFNQKLTGRANSFPVWKCVERAGRNVHQEEHVGNSSEKRKKIIKVCR